LAVVLHRLLGRIFPVFRLFGLAFLLLLLRESLKSVTGAASFSSLFFTYLAFFCALGAWLEEEGRRHLGK